MSEGVPAYPNNPATLFIGAFYLFEDDASGGRGKARPALGRLGGRPESRTEADASGEGSSKPKSEADSSHPPPKKSS